MPSVTFFRIAHQEFGVHVEHLVMLVIYTFDPQAIVFGRSIVRAFDFFQKSMYETLGKEFIYMKIVKRLHILCSHVENVGLLGASEC